MPKEALEKIDSKKRDRIFRNAASEFARHGYHKANVNSIAQRAGIGKGSIYLYFKDKLDLYHSTFREALRAQDEIMAELENAEMGALEKIEKVFEESISTLPRYRNMYTMYFDLTGSATEKSATELAGILESHSSEFFKKVVRDGIEEGSIRGDISVGHAAYMVDCVYTLFFTTLASKYQRERFRVFTDTDILKSDAMILSHMRNFLDVLEGGIAARDGAGERIKKPGAGNDGSGRKGKSK
jgi:AcrR family transcriptional regulator